MEKLINISELAIKLDLVNPKNKKPLNYILRYWEKEFSQIKPKIINKRRYYSKEQVEIFKMIKYFLKNQGLTINGVKNILNSKINKLDDYNYNSLKASYLKNKFKTKSEKILSRLNRLKKYGKKTHLKVRMVPESNPDSKFVYYAKKPTKGEKAKEKLKLKNTIPILESTKFLLKKNYHHIVNNYFFLNFLNS